MSKPGYFSEGGGLRGLGSYRGLPWFRCLLRKLDFLLLCVNRISFCCVFPENPLDPPNLFSPLPPHPPPLDARVGRGEPYPGLAGGEPHDP